MAGLESRPEQDEDVYTLAMAVHEAAEILKREFGEADQEAAVRLADSLFAGRMRAEFERRGEVAGDAPYGSS